MQAKANRKTKGRPPAKPWKAANIGPPLAVEKPLHLVERPDTRALEFCLMLLWSGVLLTLLVFLAFLLRAWPSFIPRELRPWLILAIPPIVLPVLCLIYGVRYVRWVRRMLQALRRVFPASRVPHPHVGAALLLVPVFGIYWKHRLLRRMNAALASAEGEGGRPPRAGLRAGLWLTVAGYASIAAGFTYQRSINWRAAVYWQDHLLIGLPLVGGCALLLVSSLVLHQVQQRLARAVIERMSL